MLKAINLCLFHNDPSEKYNSINDLSKKSRVSGRRFTIPLVKENLLGCGNVFCNSTCS